MIILFAKLDRRGSLPEGILHSVSFKTIEMNCTTMLDTTIEGTYYEVVKHDRCQKPYFIWSCNRQQALTIAMNVIAALKEICHQWYDDIVMDSDIYLTEIRSDSNNCIYHLILDNYYHGNGLEAQQFRELVLDSIDPLYRSKLMEQKEECRKYTRYILTRSPDLRSVVIADNKIINAAFNTSLLITYARGKLIKKKDC